MKKLFIICILLIGTFVANAQTNPFKGFFKPVEKDLFTNPNVMTLRGITDTTKGVWLFKFDAEITAIQLWYNKDNKKWESIPFSSVGPGIGYRHYIQYNGEPYCNFGVNALALIEYDWINPSATENETGKVPVSLVGTVTFLDFVNVGGGYNFGSKAPLILMGAIVKF
jgi:hypothetical protein